MADLRVGLVVYFVLTSTFSALVQGTHGDLVSEAAPDPGEDPPTGAWDILTDILGAIWDVVVFVFNAITINVPDIPAWLRIILASPNVAAIFSVGALIRGA